MYIIVNGYKSGSLWWERASQDVEEYWLQMVECCNIGGVRGKRLSICKWP